MGQAALCGQSAEGMPAAHRATSIRRPPPLHPLPLATSTAAPGVFTPRCTLSAALLTCLFYAASCAAVLLWLSAGAFLLLRKHQAQCVRSVYKHYTQFLPCTAGFCFQDPGCEEPPSPAPYRTALLTAVELPPHAAAGARGGPSLAPKPGRTAPLPPGHVPLQGGLTQLQRWPTGDAFGGGGRPASLPRSGAGLAAESSFLRPRRAALGDLTNVLRPRPGSASGGGGDKAAVKAAHVAAAAAHLPRRSQLTGATGAQQEAGSGRRLLAPPLPEARLLQSGGTHAAGHGYSADGYDAGGASTMPAGGGGGHGGSSQIAPEDASEWCYRLHVASSQVQRGASRQVVPLS